TETKKSNSARTTMNTARITGLRSVELGVPDLDKAAAFYRNVWGLEDVVSTGDTLHLRGTGAEHHVLTLRQRPKATFLGVHFAAARHPAVNTPHGAAPAAGGAIARGAGGAAARGTPRRGFPHAAAGGPAGVHPPRRRPPRRRPPGPLAADQAHPRRAQLEQDRRRARLLHRCA